MENNIFNYDLGEDSIQRILQMENEKLIFEIKLFRRIKRDEILKKNPLISETEILKKINYAQSKKFKEKQRKLIGEFLSTSFLQKRSKFF